MVHSLWFSSSFSSQISTGGGLGYVYPGKGLG